MMRNSKRRSLLIQMLSVYLLFVVVVLIADAGFNLVVEQQLRNEAQTADQALGQEIALATSLQISDDANSLTSLGVLAVKAGSPAALTEIFRAYQAARIDVDHVYWLDPVGVLQVAWPQDNQVGAGGEFSPPDIVQRARMSTGPVFEVGIAVESPLQAGSYNPGAINAGVIIAAPVRDEQHHLLGIMATSISLVELSEPLLNVVNAQLKQRHHLQISILDARGELIATPQHERILQTVLDELPGADQALRGHTVSLIGPGPNGQNWLFSAVPVPEVGWAVVVQEPASEALAVVAQFHNWLLTTALLFASGGLLFWLVLVVRVIRPLHTLAMQHQALPASEQAIPVQTTALAQRGDEVGGLARSLVRLERDGLEKLGELRTLLETSNAVVGSLDPYAVVGTIIREARRLVDVQAAAVLVPDEQGVLRVLVSDGHSAHFTHVLSLSPENIGSTAVLALRDGQPAQRLIDDTSPSFAYEEGFRSVLSIPIISRHAGSVVLLVHRTEPQPFPPNEIDLLLTFANYATLAWEHAVLYERSDERLREVAQENKRLYQQETEGKQKLEAIMGSMSDGLVLTGIDGTIIYANVGASVMAGLQSAALEGHPIRALYDALRALAVDHDSEGHLAASEAGAISEIVVELRQDLRRRAIHLRLFAVRDDAGQAIGRGLLLRDVTREREIDEFKSALLAAVGHELRTPLAAIKGHASTLLQPDVAWPVADQRHFLQTISNEADRLAQLVSNLLDLSRQEAGLLALNRTPSRVRDLVEQAVERVQRQGATFALCLPAELPLVNVDRTRIEVVLHNLVANALIYGATTVEISGIQRGDMVEIAITDNGQGIAPDELPHVFERFYRTHLGRQQRSGGTGLGLTICKAFIEAHSGAIWAANNGNGTTISLTLPLVAPELAAPPSDPTVNQLAT